MIYYIADTHFRHKGAGNFEHRNDPDNVPVFASPEARDELIIENWNDTVSADDDVYVNGDFSFCSRIKTKAILERLNGKKHMLMGNHDVQYLNSYLNDSKTGVVEVIQGIKNISDSGRDVIICHYPILCWQWQHRGSWHVYGHLHATQEERVFQEAGKILARDADLTEFRAMNCGCMLHGYKPVTLDELIAANRLGKRWIDMR